MANNNVIKFKKLIIVQLYGYMAFIPFVFAFLSLLKEHSIVDIIIFSASIITLIILLITNHIEPSVKITEDNIILYNKFKNRPVILKKSSLTDIYKVNSRLSIIKFNRQSYEIKLEKNSMKKFIKIMEELI